MDGGLGLDLWWDELAYKAASTTFPERGASSPSSRGTTPRRKEMVGGGRIELPTPPL